MTDIPASHITDSQLLSADGIVDLYELTPLVGGTLYFKPDNTVTWLGNQYFGLPCAISGLDMSADKAASQPKLQIGQDNIDLSIFKPLVHDGYADGADLVYRRILLTNLLANANICEIRHFRVKRVESYSRASISLQLSTASDAITFTLPRQQYYPPAFPAVMLT